MDLKEYIIKKSKELKIDIIGFAKADRFEELKTFLHDRREKGYETEFEEQDIDLRIDPKGVMSEGKSIIAIGVSYNIDSKEGFKKSKKLKESKEEKKGFLSKSSWGIDYHRVLKDKLETLAEEIKEIKDFQYQIHIDTGPLVDREVAKRTGIGWYGKNNSIINDDYGSFIFIGYMLTDLEIEEDEHRGRKCGECSLCISGCPTDAIEEGNKINARKCISYLTQTKERIPYDLRGKMGTKIYGCDTCQMVCPKNKGVLRGQNEEFLPRITYGNIKLIELFDMSNKEFKKKYGHMAGSWRGKNVLKRNCIIAMGNIKDKGNIDLLVKGIKDQSSMIREYSAWALFRIDKELGLDIVNKHIQVEKDDEVKEEMKRLIKYFEGDN